MSNLAIDGNRDALEARAGLPGYDQPFAQFTANNGILSVGASDVSIRDVRFRNMAGFAVLVDRSKGVRIERISVDQSGSRNAAGRNNTTGGVLLEEARRTSW